MAQGRPDRSDGGPSAQKAFSFFQANNTVLICAAAICPIMLWDTLRVTHRIAGPIERFKNVLKKLSRGDEVKDIQLRENDLLEDLRDAFNEFLASWQSQGASPDLKLSSTEVAALDRMLEQVSEETERDEVGSRS